MSTLPNRFTLMLLEPVEEVRVIVSELLGAPFTHVTGSGASKAMSIGVSASFV